MKNKFSNVRNLTKAHRSISCIFFFAKQEDRKYVTWGAMKVTVFSYVTPRNVMDSY
jgi:hypothetical protein